MLGFADATATNGQALATSGSTGKCVICHASLVGIRDFFENFNQGANARVTDLPFDDGFRQRVQDTLKPGMSAVVLVFSKITPDKALAALAPYGGEVLQTSLTKEAEEEITKALAHTTN